MQRLEEKRDTFYYTKPNFKKWVDDSTLRLLTDYYSQFLKSNINIGGFQLEFVRYKPGYKSHDLL